MRTLASSLVTLFAIVGTSTAAPRSLELEKLTWPEIDRAMADGYTRVLVTVASTEQHGPAIALGSDSFQGEVLGRRIAGRLGRTLLAPVIRMGVAPHHMHFPGTITIDEDLLVDVLLEHVRSLTAHGFDVLLLPTHGGNFRAVEKTLSRARDETLGGSVFGFHDPEAYLGAMREVTIDLGVPLGIAGGHSGELEASIVMAIDPLHVRLEDAAPGYTGDPFDLPEEANTVGYQTITDNGAIGDPTGATASKGRAYLGALTEVVSSHFESTLRTAREEDPVDGVWTYETISLANGTSETLTGTFMFIDGLFVQSAIHDAAPEEAIAQGHVGSYRVTEDTLTLEVALQIVVDPRAGAVSFSDRATHESVYAIEAGEVTVTFPSGTVQVMTRVASAGGDVPEGIYDIVGYGENRTPARGRIILDSGRFAYSAVVSSDDPTRPSAFHSGEGVAAHNDLGGYALSVRRSFRGGPTPRYFMDEQETATLTDDGRLVLETAGATWHVEQRR